MQNNPLLSFSSRFLPVGRRLQSPKRDILLCNVYEGINILGNMK